MNDQLPPVDGRKRPTTVAPEHRAPGAERPRSGELQRAGFTWPRQYGKTREFLSRGETTMTETSQTQTTELMGRVPRHYGVPVVELGEDGDRYGLAEHVDRRRALAAVRRYLRVDCQLDDEDLEDLRGARVQYRWVTMDVDGEWQWSTRPGPGAHRITVVDL